jgi:hypothetical protein
MAFDESSISNVQAIQSGGSLYITWSSTATLGTRFQVYLDRRLVWSGRKTSCSIVAPMPGGNHQIDVGTIASGDASLDLGSTLPTTLAENRAFLSWLGGRYLSLEIDHFAIYSGDSAGASVDYAKLVGKVTAYPGGIFTDGYGVGGFGQGGFGYSANSYTWTSGALSNGTWNFAVVPVDSLGNAVGTPSTVAVVIATAPLPPAANSAGQRLTYTYNPSTRVPTLVWNASPG